MILQEESRNELKSFLDTDEADAGLNDRSRQLISSLCQNDDDEYRIFSSVILDEASDAQDAHHQAARSYRAMNILKADLASAPFPSFIIKTNEQAGLLAKDLIASLASAKHTYTIFHIRELLGALLESFPERVLGAAASGGKQGVQKHLEPLFHSPLTLPLLTNLVCYGATGRKGMASAEKSAARTTMYHPHLQANKTISTGARKKFVRQMIDFELLNRLATTIKTDESAGEEVCEAILTIVEVVGYPPNDDGVKVPSTPQVGEDVMLSPLALPTWWMDLLKHIQRGNMDQYQKESIARTLHSCFALATGNSSRIVNSHAPATDATEQTSEKIVEEKEEKITNRLVEWGLTDKMHSALIEDLPVLLITLDLPHSDILNFQATSTSPDSVETNEKPPSVKHPGRYRTVPIGSWRLQLLALLKEIICYQSKKDGSNNALDTIMELPLAPELQKAKNNKKSNDEETQECEVPLHNPWPALCSFVFAYPYNDFYHNIYFEMLRDVVLRHHEPTLRVIFQKSKFLTRALRSLKENSQLQGLIIRVLNLLRLRSESLPPNAFLTQYLGSHDLWKQVSEELITLTVNQETPIKLLPKQSATVNIELGGSFASKLGLSGISKFDSSKAILTLSRAEEKGHRETNISAKTKKKKQHKKKKKKK